MYPQDLGARVLVGVRELNLAVQAAAAHEGRVQDVCAVGGSDDLQRVGAGQARGQDDGVDSTVMCLKGQEKQKSIVAVNS